MPIPVITVTPPRPPPPPVDPYTNSRIAGTWLGGNGDLIFMTDCSQGIDWQAGRSGVDMPPFDLQEDPYPGGHGVIPGSVRAGPRTIILPTLVHLADFSPWRALQQRFARALNPLNGPGTLTINQPDGTARHIQALYQAGAEGDGIVDFRGLWFRKWAVSLRAAQPFWLGEPVAPVVFKNTASAGFLGAHFLPIHLDASQVLGATSVVNVGDVEAFPVWRVNGPATVVTLTNDTTGKTLTITHTMTGAEWLEVDTRPLHKSITSDAGVNLWDTVSVSPSLWSLEPGQNHITISVTGATVDTEATMTYDPLFLTG